MTVGCFESCFYYSKNAILHLVKKTSTFCPPLYKVLLSYEFVMQLIRVPCDISSLAKLLCISLKGREKKANNVRLC